MWNVVPVLLTLSVGVSTRTVGSAMSHRARSVGAACAGLATARIIAPAVAAVAIHRDIFRTARLPLTAGSRPGNDALARKQGRPVKSTMSRDSSALGS